MITLTGDINFTDNGFDPGFGVGSLMQQGVNPFCNIERKTGDIWIGNFEGVSSNISKYEGLAHDTFRIAPKYLMHMQHCDIYNVANNHTMEHGSAAYKETINSILDFGSKVFGDADNKSYIFEHQGLKFVILGFCLRKEIFGEEPLYWYNPELAEIEAELLQLEEVDYKIAYIHWGTEFVDRPYNEQVKFARTLIDKGVDLIVGMHPHLLQGYEVYKGKYIFYSIGNFVFNMHWEPLRYGALVHLDVNSKEVEVSHSYVRLDNFFPVVIEEKAVPEKYRFDYLNNLIRFDMNYEEYADLCFSRLKEYHKDNRKEILKNFLKIKPKDTYTILSDFVKRRIIR